VSQYIVNRLGQTLIVVFISSIVIFGLVRAIPGDPASMMAPEDASIEEIETVREDLGLNDPLLSQYVNWLADALRGDFGRSYIKNLPVLDLLKSAVVPTLELAVCGYVFAFLVGLPIGILAGLKPGGPADYFATFFTISTLGIPNFILGLLLLWLVGVQLHWLPISGRVSVTEDPVQAARFLILPTIAVGSSLASVMARFVRASMQEVMNQDYVRTARSKGLRETDVVLRHALRNALIPLITVAALQVGALITGAIVVEVVFSRPGFGSLIVGAVTGRDYVMIQAMLGVFVGVFTLANMMADIAYGFVDPRIRQG
jgi:peptide/nickel transport system permease protein